MPCITALCITAALPGCGLAAAGNAAAPSPALDPARPGWSEIRMTATKLFLSAEAHLALRTVPDTSIRSGLLSIPGMRESIREGMAEPLSKAVKKLEW